VSLADGARRRRKFLTIRFCVAMAVVLAAGAAVGLAFQGLGGGFAVRVLSAGGVLRGAAAVAVGGSDVWVVKDPGNGGGSVAELSAGDGSVIRTLSGGRYGVHYPAAVAVSGGRVWVANDPQTGDGRTSKPGDGTVTELNAGDGSWVRTVSGLKYGFDFPSAVAVSGGHVWVANYWGGSVTELNASDGSWVRTLSGGRYGFIQPSAITVAGSHIWVANAGGAADNGGGSVTELNAGDGSWVQTLSSARYGFNDPSAIAAVGGHIWVANLYGNSVTELNAGDGGWVQTLSGGCYNFDSPAGIAVDGAHVWITSSNIDETGGSVTELNASDGSWIRTLSSDGWAQTLRHGCVLDILTHGSYRFLNPSPIAAAGSSIWVFDVNGVTVLTAR